LFEGFDFDAPIRCEDHERFATGVDARHLHRRDVDGGRAQDRSDLADHARDVVVARDQHRAVRNRVDFETVDRDDARTTVHVRSRERRRTARDAQRRRERGRAFVAADVDAHAEFGCDRTRVDDRDAPIGRHLQKSRKKRVRDGLRIERRDLALHHERERG
jgi:hypothetical protein